MVPDPKSLAVAGMAVNQLSLSLLSESVVPDPKPLTVARMAVN